MSERDVTIKTDDGEADGLLYTPATDGKWPGIVFLTDIMGIRDANKGMAKRVADLGYAVLVPNVFYRTAKPPLFDGPIDFTNEKTRARFAEIAGPLTPEAMARDGKAYVAFLAAQKETKAGPMGAVGYCFTGQMAMRIAEAEPDRIAAAASFHGGGLYTPAPASPHHLLPRISARLYFGHAVQDQSMPAEAIEKFERALADWGGKYESETYEEAKHGWTVPGRGGIYNHDQAERAFVKLSDLFKQALG